MWSHDNQRKKKATKTNPLEGTKRNPKKKKKNFFFQHKTPSPKYIYTVDLLQSMEKKFTVSTPLPVHFPKITFTSCPTSLPKPRKKRSSHTSTPILVK
jgi:hypothetical protein